MESVTSILEQLSLFLSASEGSLRRLATSVSDARATLAPEITGVVLFVIFNFSEIKNARSLYLRLISDNPIPKWRAGGVTDEIIERARVVIFLVLLYLFYTVVQMPLTFGPTDVLSVAFLGDVVIQLFLLCAIFWRYAGVKNALRVRAKTAAKAERASTWLEEKFDGMNISLAKMRRQVARIFFVSFFLVVVQLGPELSAGARRILDGISSALSS